jgi:two-component system, cell cycle sensor histidine kinase and response regulator CckA
MTTGSRQDEPGRHAVAGAASAGLASPEEALRLAEEQLRGLLAENEHLKAQFLQAQKMEAVARLASGVAHDFKNVLTLIAGYSDLLLKRVDESDLREPVLEIREACQRAIGLAQQLLAFSRKEAPEQVRLSLNTILADGATFVRRLLGERIDLTIRQDPSLGFVMANAGQMHQVLLNLVVNARDAMPTGGHLGIEVRDIDVAPGSAEEAAGARPGPHVLLSVTDTGIGMDETTRRRALEPFFTTKAAKSGTGLGLSTVHSIVTECRGRVVIESTPGRGTSVRIFLPRLADDAGAPSLEAGAAPCASTVPATRTVLVVDEDEGMRKLLTDLLTRAGYDVRAEPGTAGTAAPRPFDLAIVDLATVQQAGESAMRLLGACPARRTIGLSGAVGGPPGGAAARFEFGATIAKPIAPRQLLRAVRDMLEAD